MIFFRADGNSIIGAGHIMRCLSIAEAAIDMNEHAVFYTAGNEFSKKIKEKGIDNIVLSSDFMKMESELVFLREEILMRKPQFIFVDSYYVTKHYLATLLECCHSYGGKLVYVDDVMSFAYPCDYLINYNIYGPDMKDTYIKLYADDGIEEESNYFPKLLLGLDYLPLRKEFANLPPRVSKEKPRDILVSTGGADHEHIALEITRTILKRFGGNDNYLFHILVGSMNMDKVEIEQLAADCRNIIVHYDIKDMVSLMRSCDVAISAAGSTLYELCATQTPTITYVVADNQLLGAEGFQKAGLMLYAGDARKLGLAKISTCLLDSAINLAENRCECEKLIMRISKFTGNGLCNIVNKLMLEE